MTIVRRLFVGGPKHGEMLDVDKEATTWVVDTPTDGRYIYARYQWWVIIEGKRWVVPIMSCVGASDNTIQHAMATAWMTEHADAQH